MLKLRKQIDFNLLCDDNEDVDVMNKMELDGSLSEETSPSPPPIRMAKISVSRVFPRRQSLDKTYQKSPSAKLSPCTPGPRSSTSAASSFYTTPSPTQPSPRVSRLVFKPGKKSVSKVSPGKCESLNLSRKLQKSVNTNPFTPLGECQTRRKRQLPLLNFSSTPALKDVKRLDFGAGFNEDYEPSPVKRIRVADFSVTNSRYEEEFLEISEIASGEFGCVKRARHRLDGVDYAVKISKKNLDASRHDEKMALNEVFAHAALIKHKHFVRYYNSWVENGHVYIQNEFCHGGSLSKKIQEMKQSGQHFAESELRKIVVQMLKGLQYIHNKQLVHLDIKPDNILITNDDNDGRAPGDKTVDNNVDYKIGDLGHVAHVYTDNINLDPEEGDCRYMAPEFLQMDVNPKYLFKADIFSLGLTLYEAASLNPLPKNSYDDASYHDFREGRLPYLSRYSQKFNDLLSRMVTPDLMLRPNTSQLLAENNPKCNLLLEWNHDNTTVADTSIDSSDDTSTSLEEFSDSCLDNSKLDLIKAQEKIFDLEKESRNKDVKISLLHDSLRRTDSISESNLSNDEKVEKYESLLRQIKMELHTIR